jgi:ESAT-6 family protein
MADDMVLVTFSALANAAQTIQSASNSLNSKLDDLQQQLAPITATWTGAAAEGYQVQQKKWDEAQQDLTTVLKAIGTAVEQAHEAYTTTESQNAGTWSA